MRVLVTGANGFVGRYVVSALGSAFAGGAEIFPTARRVMDGAETAAVIRLDVTDAADVQREISRLHPTHVIHLAGFSTILAAVENEDLAWRVHLFGTLNVARAIMQYVPDCVLLHVGSGQVYGATAHSVDLLTETSILAPTNAQMASKAAADLALGAMAESGLRCIRFRPFNHTGPGQSEKFALPSFALQMARITAGLQEARMRVGNLDVTRDFLDVRDVASAYVQAIVKSEQINRGEIFNVASGRPRCIRDVLDEMLRISNTSVVIETDRERLRSTEIVRFVGDPSKAQRLLDWSPKYSFKQTLQDIIEYADRTVRDGLKETI